MAKFIANDALLLRSHVGTPYSMAPQVLQRIEYTRKCDIWSLGIIFYELPFGQLPWLGKNESALLESIMITPLSFPSYVSPPLKEILGKMLAMSESQRIGLEELEKYFELH
jgi:serine/threonine-protein kinase ULK/ATG1